MKLTRRQVGAGLMLGAAMPKTVFAQAAVADFFKDRTIRLIVGTPPGAGYDTIARIMAVHLSRKIPGNPKFIVENMTGAASLIMMNHLYNVAARDGTAMGLPLNGVVLEPTLKLLSRTGGNVQFDVEKMNWLGTTSEEPQVLWVRSSSKIMSFDDVRTIKSVVGASAPGADNFIVATLINRLLDGKLDIISGYQGTNDVLLASERGEVEGSCTAFSAITAGRPDWIPQGKIRVLLQFGLERLPELASVPTAIEVAKSDETKQMLAFYAIKFRTAYPFVLPPDVPADRLAAIRTAFDTVLEDADFAQDVKKANMSLKPLGWQKTTDLIRSTYKVPTDAVDKLRNMLLGK